LSTSSERAEAARRSDPLDAAAQSRHRFELRILVFTCAGHSLTHVFIHLFTAIQDEMRASFGLSDEGLTKLASISLVLFGAGAIPAGWLSDRYGEKPLLVAFYVLSALGALVIGLAPDTLTLGCGFAIVGLGTSIYHPVGLALISKGLRRPGRGMGINGLFGSLGTAVSPLVAAGVTWWTDDWRWAFLVLTAPTLLLGLAMGVCDFGGRLSIDAAQPPANIAKPGDGTPSRQPGERRALYRIVAWLLAAMACGGVYYALVITKLPELLAANVESEFLERDVTKKTWLPFFVYLIGGASQIIGGHLIDRRDGRGMYVVILLIAAPLIWALGRLHDAGLVGTACAMAFFLFAVQPVENTLLARYSPPALRGVVYGLKFVIVFGAGMGIGTWLSGRVAGHYGLGDVFTCAAVFAWTAAVFAIVASAVRTNRREHRA